MNNDNNIIRLIHRGTGGQQGWIYSIYGIMSTIPSCCYKDPPKIIIKGKQNDEERKCCGAVNS